MAIRPVYSKLVLPSRKSLELIINIKIQNKINIYIFFNTKNGGCPLIRACSLIRSNTVVILYLVKFHYIIIRLKRFVAGRPAGPVTIKEGHMKATENNNLLRPSADVPDIVAAVREGAADGREDLEEGEQLGGLRTLADRRTTLLKGAHLGGGQTQSAGASAKGGRHRDRLQPDPTETRLKPDRNPTETRPKPDRNPTETRPKPDRNPTDFD